MVSLASDQNRGAGGCYYFNSEQSCENDVVDDGSLVSTVLTADEEPFLYTLPTPPVIILEILGVVGLFATALAFTLEKIVNDSFILNTLHIGIWLGFIFGHYFFTKKHKKLLFYGYLKFYKKTTVIKKMPLFVISAGNAILLFFTSFPYYNCQNFCNLGGLEYRHFVLIIVGIETLILLPSLIWFGVLTVKFNQNKTLPDIHTDAITDLSVQGPVADIGYRDEHYVEELLEKQSDMVHYLKQHYIHLSKKILKLTEELNALKASNNVQRC